MNKRTDYTFGYPASLSTVKVSKVTNLPSRAICPADVAAFAADAFGVACIFAGLVLFLMVTK